MKKLSYLIATVVVLALSLSSCGSGKDACPAYGQVEQSQELKANS